MSYGLLGIQNQMESQAIQGLQQTAQIQQQNKIANDQLKAAEKAQTTQSVGMGAGIGAMYGASAAGGAAAGGAATGAKAGAMAGPWGMVIGAGIGFLVSKLF